MNFHVSIGTETKIPAKQKKLIQSIS